MSCVGKEQGILFLSCLKIHLDDQKREKQTNHQWSVSPAVIKGHGFFFFLIRWQHVQVVPRGMLMLGLLICRYWSSTCYWCDNSHYLFYSHSHPFAGWAAELRCLKRPGSLCALSALVRWGCVGLVIHLFFPLSSCTHFTGQAASNADWATGSSENGPSYIVLP